MSTALTGHRPPRLPAAYGTLTAAIDGNLVQSVLVTGEVLTIGRLPANRVVLPHPMVSRQHAEVRVEGGRVLLTDVGSSAGTNVNGVRLGANQPVLLDAGSDVRIGPYRLAYTPSELGLVAQAQEAEQVEAYRQFRTPSGPMVSAEEIDELLAPVSMRPTFPMPLAAGPASRYLAHLPAMFQENEFLGRFLLLFESVWEPLEQRQDHLPLYFDPRTAPSKFLEWLASWLHLTLNPHWPEERRRLLLDEAMELYRWRGTPYGLSRMLEVCTGCSVHIAESPDTAYTFHIAVTVPHGARAQRELVEQLVVTHKPAHVGYTLEFTS
jgi:phage tail-like protein